MTTSDLVNYLATPVAQVALIIGLAEVVKRLGLKSSLIPLVDVGLGLISGICFYGLYSGLGVAVGINLGLAMGLSACGLFSGIKNVAQLGKEKLDVESDGEEDDFESEG